MFHSSYVCINSHTETNIKKYEYLFIYSIYPQQTRLYLQGLYVKMRGIETFQLRD